MAKKCDLLIELDRPNGALVAGDELTGKVTLTPEKDLEVKEVVVEQVWETHGAGTDTSGCLVREVKEGRRCMAGIRYEFPFSLAVPTCPLSYHGRLVKVDHYLKAHADVARKIDPRAKIKYMVRPGPGSRVAAIAAHLGDTQEVQPRARLPILVQIILAPLVLVLVVLLFALVLAALIIALPIMIVIGLVKLIRQSAAERKLGKVEVEIGAEIVTNKQKKTNRFRSAFGKLRERFFLGLKPEAFAVSPGETVPVMIRFRPRAATALNEVVLVVTATEETSSGSGSSSHRQSKTMIEERTVILSKKRMADGGPVELRSDITMPALKAWTFQAPANKVSWSLVLHIDVAHAPDWVQEHTLVVVPQDC